MRFSERVTFEGGNGFLLAGILDVPEVDIRGTAVFTHCFTCTKDIKAIVRISRGLAEAGYAVLRYDLTGLGDSQGDFSQTNFTTNRADLAAAHNLVQSRFGRVDFLIGHSFGGACSLSMVQQLDAVRAVASLAAPSDTVHLAELLLRKNPNITRDGYGNVEIGGRTYRITQQMIDDFRAFDLPATLRHTCKPAILFHSPVDETLGFEHVIRLYSMLTNRPAPDQTNASPASLVCLPGADHLLSNNPADISFITRVIATWFDRILMANV